MLVEQLEQRLLSDASNIFGDKPFGGKGKRDWIQMCAPEDSDGT